MYQDNITIKKHDIEIWYVILSIYCTSLYISPRSELSSKKACFFYKKILDGLVTRCDIKDFFVCLFITYVIDPDTVQCTCMKIKQNFTLYQMTIIMYSNTKLMSGAVFIFYEAYTCGHSCITNSKLVGTKMKKKWWSEITYNCCTSS